VNETLTKLFDLGPYQLDRVSKENLLMERLRELEEIHQTDSKAYSRLATANIFQSNEMNKLSQVPFLPVQLFKSHALDFYPVWDGYDLLTEFSKRLTLL